MKIILAFLASLLLPNITYAALEITEVMYSPDKGGEWVEVYNNGDTPVDLKGYKLFDGVNHTISSASVIVPAGGFIILADDKSAFASAYNAVTAPIIDIVTSFNNEGDTIVVRNASNVDLVSVTYGANAGADKNGKTLQLIEGQLLPFKPASPGEPAQVTKVDVDAQIALDKITTTTAQTNTSSVSSPYHAWPSDLVLYVNAGGDRVVLAGARTTFEGKVLSSAKKPLPNADLIWTFGDGGSDRGTRVGHTFHYPGKYIVILDVISGDYIAKDEIMIDVVAPKLVIANVQTGDKGYIEIRNDTIYKLDIGEYVIEAGGLNGGHFSIPKNTMILPASTIILPSQITRLPSTTADVVIKFPGGDLITEYAKEGSKTTSFLNTAEDNAESQPEAIIPRTNVVSNVSDKIAQAKEYLAQNVLPSVFSGFVQDDIDTATTSAVTSGEGSTTTEVSLAEATTATPLVAAANSSAANIPNYLILAAIIGLAGLFVVVLRIVDLKQTKAEALDELAQEIEIVE